MRKQNGGETGSDGDESDDEYPDGSADPPWEDPDRGRGILTPSDRKYLLGEKKLEGQDERNARYRIRQRITDSLYDIILINIYLQQSRDKRQILENFNTREPIEALFKLGYDLLKHEESVDNHLRMLEAYIQGLVSTDSIDGQGMKRATVEIEIEAHSSTEELLNSIADDMARLRDKRDVDPNDELEKHWQQAEGLLRGEISPDELDQED